MKATLIGRPKKIVEERQDGVKALFEYTYAKPVPLPKGVPPLPTTPTPYIVYIGGKQWRKVKDTLADPEDSLIVEGYVAYDPTQRSLIFCCQNCTSVKQQRALREQQRASTTETPAAENAAASDESATLPPADSTPDTPPAG